MQDAEERLMGGFTGQRWQDTPEIIQMCLNCGKPTCVRECEELKQALREKRRKVKEARLKAREAVKA